VTLSVTIGRGKKRPQGELVELDDSSPAASLGLLLSQHTGIEAWWSGATFTDNHRSNDRWISQQIIGVDVDYHDTLGQHAFLTEEARKALRTAIPSALCAWAHLTPRGARLITILDSPVVDRGMYPLAWASLTTRFSRWVPKVSTGSLRIDNTCRDLARYFWSPRATIDGFVRGPTFEPGIAVGQ